MPGFVFGGTIQPFVTGLVPVVASGNYRIQPVALSPVGRMLLQGDLQVRKDTNKGPNLIISESLKRRADEPPPAPPEPGNAFRRGIEKYASPKR
jgi:hypothetical protein